MRATAVGFAIACLLASARAYGQGAPPAPHEDDAFDFMNVLADRHLHDLADEAWNAYGQFTYITSFKAPFSPPYTNANGAVNSFTPEYERGFTGTFTLFFGVKVWHGGEVYAVPELISEHALSNLHGLGGAIENFELQKTGSVTPSVYRSRLFLRQAFDLGGETSTKSSDPMQLGGAQTSRRIVITAGNFTVLDVLGKNNVLGDPRQTFFNIAFMAHSSWDFASDARGYSFGATAELYWDRWAVRVARMAPPQNPNTLAIDPHIERVHGDALELAHDHELFGQPGAVRLLGYRNRVFSGRFDDAIAAYEADPSKNAASCPLGSYNYGSTNFDAPDFCWVRKANVKVGIGIDAEQYVAPGVGVFFRAMYSDGQSEVDAFNSADRDLSFGAVAKGVLWHRPLDVTGIGLQLSSISNEHARFLAMGGIDNFIGDGKLGTRGAEGVVEGFYSVNLLRAIWLAADLQVIWNPAYNADRAGPIVIPAVKVHGEF